MIGPSLEGSTDRAVKMLRDMVDPKYVTVDKVIPTTLVRHCEGIAFITIIKAGLFMLGGNIGGGCVISKIKDPNSPRGWRWSGPSAVVVGGMNDGILMSNNSLSLGLGGGFIFGGSKISSIIILNTRSAVRAFQGSKQVTFGGNLSIAVGPAGRDLDGHVGLSDTKEIVAAYSYSQSKGAMIGATLEGAFLSSSMSQNVKFYGVDNATPENVLAGEIDVPLKAQELGNALYAILDRKENSPTLSISNPQPGLDASNNLSINSSIAESGKKLLSTGLSGEGDLPTGWSEAIADNGQLYYYNRETNQTQWERPVAPRPPSLPPSIQPQIPIAQAAPVVPKKQGPPPPRRVFATALYDYTAQHPDELTFKAQDKLRILDKSDPSWWSAEVSGRKGLIPSNYVKV